MDIETFLVELANTPYRYYLQGGTIRSEDAYCPINAVVRYKVNPGISLSNYFARENAVEFLGMSSQDAYSIIHAADSAKRTSYLRTKLLRACKFKVQE